MIKPHYSITAILSTLMVLLSSCSQMQTERTETIPEASIILEKKNFRVLATRAVGEDAGFSLFPGTAIFTKLVTLIPGLDKKDIPDGILLDTPSEYKALNNLYKTSGACHTGRATALINVRKETGGWNAVIIGRPRIRITADLIEFIPSDAVTPSEQTETKTRIPHKPVRKKRRR